MLAHETQVESELPVRSVAPHGFARVGTILGCIFDGEILGRNVGDDDGTGDVGDIEMVGRGEGYKTLLHVGS